MRELLALGSKFVFAVDTVACRCADDSDYRVSVSVRTKEGYGLVLKSKNRYEEQTQTQFSPAVYELYDGETLLQSEPIDFRPHLYRFGELVPYLREAGFTGIKVYSSYQKEIAVDDRSEMFLLNAAEGAKDARKRHCRRETWRAMPFLFDRKCYFRSNKKPIKRTASEGKMLLTRPALAFPLRMPGRGKKVLLLKTPYFIIDNTV